jgi:hypothetical protein
LSPRPTIRRSSSGGQRPNHILHLILTLITLGIWGIVWIAIVALGGEKRGVIEIDEYGNTNIQQ